MTLTQTLTKRAAKRDESSLLVCGTCRSHQRLLATCSFAPLEYVCNDVLQMAFLAAELRVCVDDMMT